MLNQELLKMKKNVFLITISLFSVFNCYAQENKVILVHPTRYNLELFTNLVDKNIVDLKNFKLVGVYHQKEKYDYEESKDFILENNRTDIELIEIAEVIEPNKLFEINTCTHQFEKLFKTSKGILFFGGPDLPPAIYGEAMSLLTRMTDPYRHYFEASFMFHLLGGSQNETFTPLLTENPTYTVYAICLGMQTMNIATGGTMIQDIPTEIYKVNTVEQVLELNSNEQHRNYNNNLEVDSTFFSGSFHRIKIANLKPIVKGYNENLTPVVYSNHHQAIEKLGKNLNAIATSMDGKIIEAITHKNFPNVLGIQFHPEGQYLHDPEIKYRKNSNQKLKSGLEILQENNSYQFHLELWKTFSNKINSSN